jgi:hypothetical protein
LGHNPERLGSFEVEDQLELGWVLHGQIGGLRAIEYAVDIERRSPPDVSAIGSARERIECPIDLGKYYTGDPISFKQVC